MGSAQKYSLKWNDFGVNVASTFRDLHSRHDFADVTIACADGSTLEAHKVILSSVSSYFRDILKTTPCKHPIIILKDTGRDEAEAMLEFAYTGEVNVAQDLLPALLHTARSFKIKGLDKVESPMAAAEPRLPISAPPLPPPPPPAHQTLDQLSWHGSRPQSPNLVVADVKPPPFLTSPALAPPEVKTPPPAHLQVNERRRQREVSPTPSTPVENGATSVVNRTPPPKRWKKSFDMSNGNEPPTQTTAENYSTNRSVNYDSAPPKRFADPPATSTPGRTLPYPHSMPTSPTMFERGNEIRLAGFIRHHLSTSEKVSSSSSNGNPRCSTSSPNTNLPILNTTQATTAQQRPESCSSTNGQSNSVTTSNGNGECDAIDYRCYNNGQTKIEEESDFAHRIRPVIPAHLQQQQPQQHPDDDDRFDRRMTFRPESAPTVLDMSPDNSMSGPPSIRGNMDLNDTHELSQTGDDLSDCGSKSFTITPDAMGRYSCDECGKIFKHPGSLQHHRHIHRGTHKCPSCGKAFSRRWDMERHLNKSKYGCPANRFSTGSTGSSESERSAAHIELLSVAAAAAANGLHNMTA